MEHKSSAPLTRSQVHPDARYVWDCFDKIDKIGQGTYGEVLKAKDKATGACVALKRIKMEKEQEGFPITAIREIKILTELKHDNIVNLLEVVTAKEATDTSVFLVFEFMEHDLAGLLNTQHKDYISASHAKCWMKQLLHALHYMHSNKVIHRDLKAANILLSNTGCLKLADFGLARPLVAKANPRYTNKVITLWYRPPELLLGAVNYGPSVDIWSAGCILAELLEKKILFGGDQKERPDILQLDVIWEIMGVPTEESWPEARNLQHWREPKKPYPGCFNQRFQSYGESTLELLKQLLSLNPEKRPSAHDALLHNFFWSEPLPTKPEDMPSFPSSHEWVTQQKKRARPHPGHSQPDSDPKRFKPDYQGRPYQPHQNQHGQNQGHHNQGRGQYHQHGQSSQGHHNQHGSSHQGHSQSHGHGQSHYGHHGHGQSHSHSSQGHSSSHNSQSSQPHPSGAPPRSQAYGSYPHNPPTQQGQQRNPSHTQHPQSGGPPRRNDDRPQSRGPAPPPPPRQSGPPPGSSIPGPPRQPGRPGDPKPSGQ